MQIRWGKVARARELSRLGCELSRAGQLRLRWMTHYLQHGRIATFTCRHFGISRQTFYRWWRRYDPHDLATLEDRSHCPRRRRRQPTWTSAQAQAVLLLRREYPRWGKDKLVILLARQNFRLSTSMVGRILSHLKRRGVLVEAPAATASARRRKMRGRPWAVRKPRFLAHSAARGSGSTRHQRTPPRARRGVETLLGSRHGLSLGCPGSS